MPPIRSDASRWQEKILAWSREVLGQILEELRPNPHPRLHDKGDRIASFMAVPAVAAKNTDHVAEVIKRITPETSDPYVFISDSNGTFQGVVPIAKVFAATPETPVDAEIEALPRVHDDETVGNAITVAMETGTPVLAVVDVADRLMGIVPAEILLHLVRQTYGNALKRFAGIRENSEQALTAIEGQPGRRVVHRLPWLLVGTFGSMIATLIMAGFEDVLRQNIEVAFFIPGLVYLADAIGTQSEAIAVRGLTFSRTPIKRLWWGELQTGVLLGLTLALLVFPFIWIAFSAALALAVAVALVFASSVATSIGLLFPWLLARVGKDPAYGSGPIATILQDLLSLIIYFLTVSALVF